MTRAKLWSMVKGNPQRRKVRFWQRRDDLPDARLLQKQDFRNRLFKSRFFNRQFPAAVLLISFYATDCIRFYAKIFSKGDIVPGLRHKKPDYDIKTGIMT